MANNLPFDQQAHIIALLVEGNSLRATSRLTGVHRDTIGRLAVRVGEGCARLHDRMMRNLNVTLLELDEAWAFVGAKQKTVKRKALKASKAGTKIVEDQEQGDQYAYIGMDAARKAIISYSVGKRTPATTNTFAQDLRDRIVNRPQITTDGFGPYIDAIERAFGHDVDYAMLVKQYAVSAPAGAEHPMAASRRYTPGKVVSVKKQVVRGSPKHKHISTSYVERQNLTLRMHMRRFTRLTNGFSKRLRNHKAALALHIAWYNLCRVHETLRVTPAMEVSVADHVWSIAELLGVVLAEPGIPAPVTKPKLRLIQGGVA